jgi:hypothetical protein
MVQELAEWFGEFTSNIEAVIRPAPGSELSTEVIPYPVAPGRVSEVTVHARDAATGADVSTIVSVVNPGQPGKKYPSGVPFQHHFVRRLDPESGEWVYTTGGVKAEGYPGGLRRFRARALN